MGMTLSSATLLQLKVIAFLKRGNVVSISGLDEQAYKKIIQFTGSMSSLYSESDVPLIHPRLVEKLFCFTTGSKDLARHDSSFDAYQSGDRGVGVKTYRSDLKKTTNTEKVAEFTKIAASGVLHNKSKEDLAYSIAELRNMRVASDTAEYGLDLDKSYYHCLIRVPGGAFFHEEPYGKVNIPKITPADATGKATASFDSSNFGHVYFRDDVSFYSYNVSKNVLYKRFETSKGFNSDFFPIPIISDLLKKVVDDRFSLPLESDTVHAIECAKTVVLPLYSSRSENKVVAPRSGINQWNARGRVRSFGEAYIPVPIAVHREYPNFFPPRDTKFKLRLPNGKIIFAKICQQDGKALMSDPNTDLCEWLFSTIDGSMPEAEKRLVKEAPYTYSDLLHIGKDSVTVTKLEGEDADFEITSASLNSYEDQFL